MKSIMNRVSAAEGRYRAVWHGARAFLLGAGVAVTAAVPTQAFGWSYSDIPLFWASGAPPNVVIDVDNSASMKIMVGNDKYQQYQEGRLFKKADGTVLATPIVPGNMASSTGTAGGTDDYDEPWYFCTAYTNSTKNCTKTDQIDRLAGGEAFTFQTPLLSVLNNTKTVSVTNTSCNSSCVDFGSPGTVYISNHGFTDGTLVTYSGTGAGNITGLPAGNYFVVNAGTNSFRLSTTLGGTAIKMSGSNTTNRNHTFTGRKLSLSPQSYIYDGINGPDRQSARSPQPVMCNVTRMPGDLDFVIAHNIGLQTTTTTPISSNIGVLVTKSSGSTTNTVSCVRFKEASTAVSPPAAGVTPLSTEAANTKTTYPASVDLYSAWEFRYTLFQLNKHVRTPGRYNFADTSVYPDNDPDPSVDNDTDFNVVPNLNRIQAARMALQEVIVDNIGNTNIGLFKFNGNNRGEKLLSCNSGVDNSNTPAAQLTALVGANTDSSTIPGTLDGLVGGLRGETGTPLSKSAYEVAQYFRGATGLDDSYTSPIRYRCQKNYMVVMTDGEPTSSDNPSSGKYGSINANYDGYSETSTNWYVDDMAQYMWNTDMKTTGNDGTGKSWNEADFPTQNVGTYAIGFGLQNDLLKLTPLVNTVTFNNTTSSTDAATDTFKVPKHGLSTGDMVLLLSGTFGGTSTIFNGDNNTNGKYYAIAVTPDSFKLATTQAKANAGTADVNITTAANGTLSIGPGRAMFSFTAEQLAADLKSAFRSINAITSSASAVATNSTRLNGDTRIFQARFNTEDWSGDLQAYPITVVEGTGKRDEVSLGTPDWKASSITSTSRGQMLTWNGTSAVNFTEPNLTTAQRTALSGGLTGTAASAEADKAVRWIRGENITGFRERKNGIIGDIINSDPAFVGALNFGYMRITDPCTSTDGETYDTTPGTCTGGALYAKYVEKNLNRGMIFFGANDGQMHGFNASTGAELVSYIPAGVYVDHRNATDYKLHDLTQPNYSHKYFVDGSPFVGDAFIGGSWGTYLASGLGAGGKSIFVLDVSDNVFGTGDVKWEKTYNAADSHWKNLGVTMTRPIIARLPDGEWVVIFGNGPDSATNTAQLFVVKLSDGTVIARKDTNNGSATTPNGMTAVQVQVNADRTVTAIYGGDLLGNIWRFDVNQSNGNVGNATKIFQATDGTNPQPITGGIRLGSNPQAGGKTMVFFGTGKYFETTDNLYNSATSKPKFDTFYGIVDDGSVAKSNLVEQKLTSVTYKGVEYRTMTTNPVNYSGGKEGWYVNLAAGTSYKGERVVSMPTLYGGRIIFVSLVPDSSDICTGKGSSWLYEVDALTGANLGEAVFDTNGDGKVDDADAKVAAVSNPDGIMSEPAIISAGETEYKLLGSTSASKPIVTVQEDPPPQDSAGSGGVGRMSWQQLQ